MFGLMLIWLTVVSVPYAYLRIRSKRRGSMQGPDLVVAIAFAFLLAPGGLFGHGMLPLPAGFGTLLASALGDSGTLMINAVSWGVTAGWFFIINLLTINRKAPASDPPPAGQ